MLIEKPNKILLSVKNVLLHGEYDAEKPICERELSMGAHNPLFTGNRDPLYYKYKKGNDLGYVQLAVAQFGSMSALRAFSPVEMSGFVDDETSWLHTIGAPIRLGHLFDLTCLPTSAQRSRQYVRASARYSRRDQNHNDSIHNIGVRSSRSGRGYTIKRCERCLLTLMHPLMHLLQPNRLVATMTIVYSFVGDRTFVFKPGGTGRKSYRQYADTSYVQDKQLRAELATKLY